MKLPISSAEDRAVLHHLFIQEILQKAWLWGILTLLTGLCFPVQAARIIGSYTAEELAGQERLLPDFIEKQEILCVLLVAAAVAIALVQFGFLYKRETVDFYFSLPISRKNHFRYRCICGFLFFAAPFCLMYWMTLMVAIANDILIVGCFGEIIQVLLLYLLFFWNLYEISIIAVLAAGSYLPALVMEGVVHFGGPIICALIMNCQNSFFKTYVNTGQSILPGDGSILTTGRFIIRSFHRHSPEQRTAIFIMILLAMVLPLLAEKMFIIRPAEKNGRGMVWPLSGTIIHGAAVISGGIVAGLILMETTFSNKDFWLYSGIVIGCLLTHLALQMMIQVSFRAVFQGGIMLLVTTFMCSLVVSVFRFDLCRYDSYLPDESRLESIGISFTRLEYYRDYPWDMTQEEYEMNNTNYTSYSLLTDDPGFFQIAEYRKLEEMKLTDMEPVFNIINYSMNHFEEIQYEDHVVVCYRLKNGKSVFRRYPIPLLSGIKDEKLLAAAARIFDEKEYKKNLYPILKSDIPNKPIRLDPYSRFTDRMKAITLSDSRFKQFLDTYRKELLQFSYDELRTTEPLLTIRFSDSDEDFYNCYPVYPGFAKTIALLTQNGADCSPTIEKIRKIQLQYDDNGDYKSGYITDAEQIEELKRLLINSSYFNTGMTLKEAEIKYLFSCTILDPLTSEEAVIAYYLPVGKIPDFCKIE